MCPGRRKLPSSFPPHDKTTHTSSLLSARGRGERAMHLTLTTSGRQRRRCRLGDDAQLTVKANRPLQPCGTKYQNEAPSHPLVIRCGRLPVSDSHVNRDSFVRESERAADTEVTGKPD